MGHKLLPGLVLRRAFTFAIVRSQIGFPFVPIAADFCYHVRKGVIESHIGGLHERPGLRFQQIGTVVYKLSGDAPVRSFAIVLFVVLDIDP
jgi:hypothetical protein